jgi:hypothetical protein
LADPRQIRAHGLEIGVTAVGRLLQGPVDDGRQARVDAGDQGGERRGRLVQHLQENRLLRLSAEGLPVGEELVKHQTR